MGRSLRNMCVYIIYEIGDHGVRRLETVCGDADTANAIIEQLREDDPQVGTKYETKWSVRKEEVLRNIEQFEQMRTQQLKAKALAKLTEEEIALLGLGEIAETAQGEGV